MIYNYCPVCGGKLVMEIDGGQHVPTCQNPDCKFAFWQNPKPTAVIMIPNAEGKILMTVRAEPPDQGKLDLPGGYLNETELPEVAAKREAMEELGVEIEILRVVGFVVDTYYGDKGHTLNIGFEAKIIYGEPKPLDEIEAIEWVDPEQPPLERLAFNNNAKFLAIWHKSH